MIEKSFESTASSFFVEIRSLISNNPHLSVRSSVSCGVLIFVSSSPCDGKRMDALCGAIISGEKCFGTFDRTRIIQYRGRYFRQVSCSDENWSLQSTSNLQTCKNASAQKGFRNIKCVPPEKMCCPNKRNIRRLLIFK